MGSVSLSLSPSPATQGQSITITTSGLPTGHELKLSWVPPGQPDSVEVGPDGKATVTVPDGAGSLVVSDPDSGTEVATGIWPA